MSQANNPTARQAPNSPSLHSAAVTDRGMNPKRPLNEDSFLADSERGIFSVADGVGGAEAGEVASQTAIEVLDEAFRHQTDGADIEDLMELAIQRANASIHQMAQDHPKFSMMATTIVGLHLKGNVATIGHVGDSRLYRLTPAGQLLRETEDHSVVEEEVRAGRMTAEQAMHHPSKNVISRALGAEDVVEVDMKVIEVDDGTEFLLCTDGITRHIPDHELRRLLITYDDLTTLCGEFKRICFERGAEDNLTAVVVRVGAAISAAQRMDDLDKTISPETTPFPAVNLHDTLDDDFATDDANKPDAFVPASRKAFPSAALAAADAPPSVAEVQNANAIEKKLDVAATTEVRAKSGVERTMTRFFLLVLVAGALAAAFYAGRKYKGPIPYLDANTAAVAQPSPTPVVGDDPILKFERSRREVDNDPNAWLATPLQAELTRLRVASALEASDAEFLYLYGRAKLLVGDNEEAVKAFEAAIARASLDSPQANATLKKEATLGLAAVALKSDKDRPAAQLRYDEVMRQPPPSSLPSSSSSAPSSSSSPLSSP
jgi:serine/threonine protein phosphatase PrpC